MNAARVECQRLITGLKRRASETCEGPATIRAQVLQNTFIKRLRHDGNAPRAEPLNLEQLEIPNAYRIYKRTEIDEEQFLLAYTGVFQIQGQNEPQRASTADWIHEMKDIYADGTFSLTPPLFSQIYVLLAKRDGWVFPTRVYNTDPIFAEKSKMITSLAFLPVHHLQAGLNALQAQLPAQLHGVFNWFLDNYTGRMRFNVPMSAPLFDPHEWSVISAPWIVLIGPTISPRHSIANSSGNLAALIQQFGDSLTRSDVSKRRLMLIWHLV
ncbi:hypothetical protein niasHT_038522 [Heterodera trifolii]|uniref:Uncharacterized protein n=1 Tax=Heterodera trifolii TaxID=157864 RepID=A0ABD2HYJ7_9BILA